MCGDYAFIGIINFRSQCVLTCFNLLVLEFADIFSQVQDKAKKKKINNSCPTLRHFINLTEIQIHQKIVILFCDITEK